jgi:hypothetical protein
MSPLGERNKPESHGGDFALNPITSFHSATSSGPSGMGASSRKRWQVPRISPFPSSRSNGSHLNAQRRDDQLQPLSPEQTRNTTVSSNATAKRRRWWKVQLFRGMINDIKRRAPYYWSDWRDAWDYRVVPATVYMYFAKYGLQKGSISFVSLLLPFFGFVLRLSSCVSSGRRCRLELPQEIDEDPMLSVTTFLYTYVPPSLASGLFQYGFWDTD